MNQIFKEELSLYFVRPNWGGSFIDTSKAIEVACSSVDIIYDANYKINRYYDNDRVETKKSASNSGSINLTIPLTYQNFDFLFDAQHQLSDMSTVTPRIYQAGMLYNAIEFQSLSIGFGENDVVVMDISFKFYDISHCIAHLTADDPETPDTKTLSDETEIILTTSTGEILFSESGTTGIPAFFIESAKDRFTLDPSLLSGLLDANGNPIVDYSHVFFSTAPQDTTAVQKLNVQNLTGVSHTLHTSSSLFDLQESNAESAQYSILDLTILNISYSISRENKSIKSIGSCLPRKITKTSLECLTELSLPLLEEQTQALFVGAQKYEAKYASLPKFKLTISLKDVENNAPMTSIVIDGFFESMRSSINSLGVPQGSLAIIEKK